YGLGASAPCAFPSFAMAPRAPAARHNPITATQMETERRSVPISFIAVGEFLGGVPEGQVGFDRIHDYGCFFTHSSLFSHLIVTFSLFGYCFVPSKSFLEDRSHACRPLRNN